MNGQSQWQSLEITVSPEAAEAIEFALNSLEALGTSIDSLRKTGAESVTVIGYFNEMPADDVVWDEIQFALRSYSLSPDSVISANRKEIENADWLAEWKKHWKPTEIGQFVVAPPWETIESTDRIVIRIEPNMAFGTGTHETTKLCIAAIEEHFRPGDSFLDVGTGTGILAIAAAKLSGNSRVVGCDTDTDSVLIARQNAELNSVAGTIELFEGSISPDTPAFDLVCANLTLDVILPLLDLLIAKTTRTLLLSGILSQQEERIVTSLRERGVDQFSIGRMGEWISVVAPMS